MNFQIKRFVLVLFVLFGILLGISTTVFAADPSFYISPLSGSDLKLHCRYTFNAKLSAGGQSYNGFYHTIMF
ncbi:hypothetical protein K9M48_04955, partial [Candidatus Gracilibacteria bacterium]|nr:hypothetical protein [Candidatus Gracilibacteria bacterium]